MPGKAVGIFESMIANACEDGLLRCKREHTFPNVSHRGHLKCLAQRARGSTAVRHSNDSRYVQRLSRVTQLLQTVQQDWKACTAADAYNPHRPSPLITTPIVLSRISRSRRNEIFFA